MNKLINFLLKLAFITSVLLVFNNKICLIFPSVYQLQFINLGFPFYLLLCCVSFIFLSIKKFSYWKFFVFLMLIFLVRKSIIYTFAFNLKINTESNFSLFHNNPDYKKIFDKSTNSVQEIILQNDFDIICLQEVNSKEKKKFSDSLQSKKNKNIYSATDRRSPFLVTNQHKISNVKEIIFPESSNAIMRFDFEINKKKYRYISFYLQSLKINKGEINELNEDILTKISEKENLQFFVRKYAKAYSKRISQVDTLIRWVNESPYPLIISGDMNDVPYGYCYHKLMQSTKLKDAFTEAGFGISNTYKSIIPFFRIDYVFVDKHIQVSSYQKYNSTISDHFPISVQLNLP